MDANPEVRLARVPVELAGERFDRVAAELFSEFSRNQLSRWIRTGALLLDGRVTLPRQRVIGGERVELKADVERADEAFVGQAVPFEVVFADETLLVVNKPPGVVVHPGAGNPDHTLVNGLVALRPALTALPRAGLIHRLDKDTSGLLIVAGNLQAFNSLTRALARREIKREYIAVTEGVMTGGREIDAPIGRDPGNRLRQRVLATGRKAVTRVRVAERFRAHTRVDVVLDTGRTHQIRVHLSDIGYPLVGDRRYGARGRLPPAPSERLIAAIRSFRRQALHAARLAFEHPLTGEPLTFEAPVPEDLRELLAALREDAGGH